MDSEQYGEIWQAASGLWRLIAEMKRQSFQWPSLIVLRPRVMSLFESFDKRVYELSVPYEIAQDIKYAFAAFIDEVVLAQSHVEHDFWLENTLQWQLFDDNCAGMGFFKRLTRLQCNPQANFAALMVYFLCLQLGFKGRYAVETPEHLGVLQASLKQMISCHAAQLTQPSHISDFLVQRQDEKHWKQPAFISMMTCSTLVCLLYLVFQFKMSNELADSLSYLTEYQSTVQAQVYTIYSRTEND